ncbi:exodeoxyribonuclease 7 large subunit [Formosimonas limnophila]|uniref:Exodeoxyribonuclease 7 large subunit n=1 Tax=Formosimonas limnophila TaxID=1384487 RepID=A0A8J3CGF3_9BURK|nr:exodeoxyribonuclease VII large subunit [Formosimonas limnophila]GHA68305.1 exodeoxyribonuclease 7 large subunit [Formosimonas limnophila]
MSTDSLSVSEFNTRVAQLIERQIPLLWVKGEISNLTSAASGHWYFSLKDDKAQVRAVMFRHKNSLLSFQPREGDAVEAHVLASLYAPRGDFQLSVETMRRAGQGNLHERFLQLKDELQRQGLFDAAHKKALPSFAHHIGIITSPQAAALRDVCHTLERRAPHISILLYPTLVQGKQAPRQIASAIQKANQNKVLDAILIVRGGGSIEDLWAFNEPEVAHAIFQSRIPTISGIGHETDTSIADYVADIRAATPTAAAEIISTPSQEALLHHIEQQQNHLNRAMMSRMHDKEQQLDHIMLRLLTPAQRLQNKQQTLNELRTRLKHSMLRQFERTSTAVVQMSQRWQRARPNLSKPISQLQRSNNQLCHAVSRHLVLQEQKLNHRISHLKQLNPDNVLARGYTYVRAQDGTIVYNAASLQSGDGITIQFADGRVISTVNHTESP